MRKTLLSSAFLLMLPLLAAAQEQQPEMADTMRGNGKIYVVVLVLATIFAGIIMLLVRMDRKLTKLEKNNK